jgi:hypothetical protein
MPFAVEELRKLAREEMLSRVFERLTATDKPPGTATAEPGGAAVPTLDEAPGRLELEQRFAAHQNELQILAEYHAFEQYRGTMLLLEAQGVDVTLVFPEEYDA